MRTVRTSGSMIQMRDTPAVEVFDDFGLDLVAKVVRRDDLDGKIGRDVTRIPRTSALPAAAPGG